MNRHICIASAVLVITAWVVIPESGAQQGDENQNASKIRELQQKRVDALQKRYQIIQRRFDDGSLGFDHVVSSLDDLLNAKLEHANSRQEKIEVCKQRIDNLRTLEKFAEIQFNVGQGRTEERFAAEAERIQAEIECLRLESSPE